VYKLDWVHSGIFLEGLGKTTKDLSGYPFSTSKLEAILVKYDARWLLHSVLCVSEIYILYHACTYLQASKTESKRFLLLASLKERKEMIFAAHKPESR
jgi:hypothetical protein